MITDDPGTPDRGHWEVNIAATGRHSASGSEAEVPLLDINFGVAERIELKFEVPWVWVDEDGEDSESGLGNSAVGLKWRFYDAGATGWQISTYPQVEFRNPGSHSAERGLAEDATILLLPFQFQRSFAAFGMNFELGRAFSSDGDDAWLGGIVFGHEVNDRLEGMAELHVESSESLDRSALAVNVGARVAAGNYGTLLLSLGRDLHDHLEGEARTFGYVGWQLAF